jgi:tRNA(His) guanylyltransferase
MSNFAGDSLGTRMKGYESTSQSKLLTRTPVIIRIDGRAFHTFTRCLKALDPSLKDTPFSTIMHDTMMYTTHTLVENVQNCVFGYTQSDEISLLMRDWDFHETQQWFGANIQKITSISASIATAAFNVDFAQYRRPIYFSDMAQFDSRVYNLPKEEVTNYFIWRQQDASRNSIQMLGRFHFSQKQMHGKSNNEVQDMLMQDKTTNWNDLPTWMKRR